MKKIILLSALILGMPLSMMAQDDDMYFVPKNKSSVRSAKQTYYAGSDRDVDEYNRRTKLSSKVTPIDEADDIIDFDGALGVYPDSIAADTLFADSRVSSKSHTYYYIDDEDDDDVDYRYSRQLDRWYGSYDPWFYGPGYWGSHFYWRSPYYYSHYYGFYDPWYYSGYYDPWLYGFYGYYGPWYTGWYGGIYNPWYDNYWAWHHHGYWYGGGGSHGGIAGKPSTGRVSRGSAELHKNGLAGGGRRNAYNDIAKLQAAKENFYNKLQSNRVQQSYRGTGQRSEGSYSSSRTSSSFSGSRSSGGGGGFSGGGYSGGGRSGGSGGSSGGHGGRR